MPLHVVWSASVAPSSLNHCSAVQCAAGLYRGVRANTEQTCLVRRLFLVPGCNEVRVVGSTDAPASWIHIRSLGSPRCLSLQAQNAIGVTIDFTR